MPVRKRLSVYPVRDICPALWLYELRVIGKHYSMSDTQKEVTGRWPNGVSKTVRIAASSNKLDNPGSSGSRKTWSSPPNQGCFSNKSRCGSRCSNSNSSRCNNRSGAIASVRKTTSGSSVLSNAVPGV